MGSAWGSILESKHWAVLQRPFEPARVTGNLGTGTHNPEKRVNQELSYQRKLKIRQSSAERRRQKRNPLW
jgi:hypothetical protein